MVVGGPILRSKKNEKMFRLFSQLLIAILRSRQV